MSDAEYLALGFPNVHDALNQLRYHREYGLYRDHEELRKIHPNLTTFETWLRQTGWRGEAREVQKGVATGEK